MTFSQRVPNFPHSHPPAREASASLPESQLQSPSAHQAMIGSSDRSRGQPFIRVTSALHAAIRPPPSSSSPVRIQLHESSVRFVSQQSDPPSTASVILPSITHPGRPLFRKRTSVRYPSIRGSIAGQTRVGDLFKGGERKKEGSSRCGVEAK